MEKFKREAIRAILKAKPEEIVALAHSLPVENLINNASILISKCPKEQKEGLKKYISDIRRKEGSVSLSGKGLIKTKALDLGV
ncbi:MAG: hypothetical protein N4A43_02685 [Alphaproteobacteria bacterium]|jgi:hypothetical protein|nr:hypothetical protein [Alphaproteobacteria bacterium]